MNPNLLVMIERQEENVVYLNKIAFMQPKALVKALNVSTITWLTEGQRPSGDKNLAQRAKDMCDKVQQEIIRRGLPINLKADMTFELIEDKPKVSLNDPSVKEKTIKEKIKEEHHKFSKEEPKDGQ